MSDKSQLKTEDNVNTPTPKGKRRDRSASEERLLKAGKETFSKYGFNGATTRMIAKKADVNESLIGRYFDGKEGLLIAIIGSFLEEMVHRELPYPPQNSLSLELERYAADRFDVGCHHQDFIKIIFSQGLTNKKFKKRVTETIPMQLDPRLIQRVSLLAEQGKLKPGTNVEELCEDLDSYLGGVFFNDYIIHEKPNEVILYKIQRFVGNFAKFHEQP